MKNFITIGRSSDCDIILPPDTKISRIHARLSLVGGQYVYEDLGKNSSTLNGRYLNGQKVPVAPGAEILVAGRVPLPWGQIYQLLPVSRHCAYEEETNVGPSPYPYHQPSGEPYADSSSLGIGWCILAVLIPLAGWIMYFAWRDKTPKRASQVCTLAWVGFAINVIGLLFV